MQSTPCECCRLAGDDLSSQTPTEMRMIVYDQPPKRPKRIIEKLLHPNQTFDYSCHGRNWIISDKVHLILSNRSGRSAITDSH